MRMLVLLLLLFTVAFNVMLPWLTYQLTNVQTEENLSVRQRILDRSARTADIITTNIQAILAAVPTAARVRVAFLRTSPTDDDLHWTIVAGVAAPGHQVGGAASGTLAEWSDYLPALMQHKCSLHTAASITTPAAAARVQALGMSQFYACPVFAGQTLVGSIYVSWDVSSDPPPADMKDVTAIIMSAAVEIGKLPVQQ